MEIECGFTTLETKRLKGDQILFFIVMKILIEIFSNLKKLDSINCICVFEYSNAVYYKVGSAEHYIIYTIQTALLADTQLAERLVELCK